MKIHYSMVMVGGAPRVKVSGVTMETKDQFKACGTAMWARSGRFWHIAATPNAIDAAYQILQDLGATAQTFDERAGQIFDMPKCLDDLDVTDLQDVAFEPWQHQRIGAAQAGQLAGSILSHDMGCVDAETEFLSPDGWVRIDKWDGHLVAQFDPRTRDATFVQPERYIDAECERFWHISHGSDLDMMVCDDHSVAYEGRTAVDTIETRRTVDLLCDLAGNPNRPTYIPRRFYLEQGQALPYDDAELRLIVAVMADGTFPSNCSTNRCTIRVKKRPKIDRLRYLLTRSGIDFYERPCKPDGFYRFSFNSPLKAKRFPRSWWGMGTHEQRVALAHEVMLWDGDGDNNFWTTSRTCADFVQWILHSTGHHASILVDDREGKRTLYQVRRRKKNRSSFLYRNVEPKESVDGRKYCLTVPTGFLVLRRNRSVFITGNCGKTKTIYDTVLHNRFRATLVVCPAKPVRDVWEKQYDSLVLDQIKPHFSVLPLDSRIKPISKRVAALQRALTAHNLQCALADQSDLRPHQLMVVTNYEALARSKDFVDALSGVEWDLVVCDESHKLSDTRTNTWKALRKIGHRAAHRVAMTGTVMEQGAINAFGQAAWVDSGIFGTSVTKFRERYCEMSPVFPGRIDRYKNLDHFKERIGRITTRIDLTDVVDMPEFVDIDVPVELETETMKIYRSLEQEFIADVENGTIEAAEALPRLARLQQVTSGFCVVTDVAGRESERTLSHEKEEACVGLIQDMRRSAPVVVFAHFIRDLEAVQRVAEHLDRPCFEISGRRSELPLWEGSSDAQEGPIVAVQLKAGSTGIDLTRSCHGIYFSINFSRNDYVQSRRRLWRPGQYHPVAYYHLKAVGTMNERIYQSLEKKTQIVNSICDSFRRVG